MGYKIYLFLTLVLISFPAESGRVYVKLAIGIMYPDDSAGLPEIDLRSPAFKFALGYEFKEDWIVEYEHTSSIPHVEKGKGLNEVWLGRQFYFD